MKKYVYVFPVLMMIAVFACSCGGNRHSADNQKMDSIPAVTNKTIDNLLQAISIEQSAVEKFTAFAAKAREENLFPVALLFESLVVAKNVGIKKQTDVLVKMGGKVTESKTQLNIASTKENIADAIQILDNTTKNLYPEFIKIAEQQEFDDALEVFAAALEIDKSALALLTDAQQATEGNKISTLPVAYSVCTVCGMIYDTKKLPANCEVCGSGKDKFILFK